MITEYFVDNDFLEVHSIDLYVFSFQRNARSFILKKKRDLYIVHKFIKMNGMFVQCAYLVIKK